MDQTQVGWSPASSSEYNKLHYDALSDPVSMFICRLFHQAGAPWEGETHALKTTLIEVTEMWGRLAGEGVPCPVAFEPGDLRKTQELSAKLQAADENFEAWLVSRRRPGCPTNTTRWPWPSPSCQS